MKENKIKLIATHLGISETTVKRALGNYAGVSSQTKARVLAEADRIDYHFAAKRIDLGIVLPAIPSYFWGALRLYVNDCATKTNLRYRIFCYSALCDDQDALHCIDKAILHGAEALIVSVPPSDIIQQRLNRYAKTNCLVLLEEPMQIRGAFFVGEDAYKEGYRLGKAYFSANAVHSIGIYLPSDFYNHSRLSGLTDAIHRYAKGATIEQHTLDINTRCNTRAAIFARQIQTRIHGLDCICDCCGMVSLLRNTLTKIRSSKPVDIIGFDDSEIKLQPLKYGNVKVLLRQDLRSQAHLAIQIAQTYVREGVLPTQQNMFVENQFVINQLDSKRG